ncbi:alanine--tRNA ligase [Nanoarchaeota archaeon]
MLPDKEVKKKFKKEASKHPEKYYAVSAIEAEGFSRRKCHTCHTHFWSVEDSKVCGDPACSGGFTFFDNNPVKKHMNYIEVWKNFAKMFKKLGYTPIDRYPVAARWRDDTDFVQASIYDFQPWVVSGEVDPPANPLVVPQFCLRFNDIDNVGITMSHNTGFVMIGQHAFVPKDEWDQDKYFKDLLQWFTKGLGIKKKEIFLHEDAWAGGGNFGPCMEFFCRGLELANQVYMLYEQTEDGDKELKLKVLDMGMGHERNAWFIHGKGTMYDAIFPSVMKKLFKITKVHYDKEFVKSYLPHAAFLNIDEIDHIDKAWERVADEMETTVEELREKILPLAALYSVAEHARTLLVALSDGALPGNVKGGYNLRTIYRRAQSFIDKYEWDLDLKDVCEWHAEYLKPLFPELSKNLTEVKEILGVEHRKYKETWKKNKQLVKQLVEKDIGVAKLVELYDSQGIDPEEIRTEALKLGKTVVVPDNFYALVSERHEKAEQKTQTTKQKKLDLAGVEPTKILYYDHYDYVHFKAPVLKVIGKFVVLEETAFYPTSGGQENDTGTIGSYEVVDVFKQGKVVVHELMHKPDFKAKGMVECKIDFDRRLQLAQHHTATHIIGGVARRMLGEHIWQAGAAKTQEKSRLDITHYENLTEEQVMQIEKESNEIIRENLVVGKSFFARDIAEKQYGFKIYQGGAVPGDKIRIVEIKGLDVQACGGTHLNLTGEVQSIKILRSSKVQDGIVRLEFVAGNAARDMAKQSDTMLRDISLLLDCKPKQVPARCEELFNNWKKAGKAVKKGRHAEPGYFELKSAEEFDGDVLQKASEILRTQPEHLLKTITRFKDELEKYKELLAL